MSKRSLSLITFIVITILCFFISTSCNNEEKIVIKNDYADKEMFSACLYTTSGAYAYDFSLCYNKTLKLTMGLTDGKLPPNNVSIKKQGDVKISDEVFNKFENLIEKIHTDSKIVTDKRCFTDSWMIKIKYKDKTIVQHLFFEISPEIKELYYFLIQNSPIKINTDDGDIPVLDNDLLDTNIVID